MPQMRSIYTGNIWIACMDVMIEQVKDNEAGQELMRRIGMLADVEGHFPRLTVEEPDNVSAELSTIAVGTSWADDLPLKALR